MIRKKYMLIVLLLIIKGALAQQSVSNSKDSLSTKSCDYLSHAATANATDSVKSNIYTKTWLLKAKQDRNYPQMVLAYKAMMYLSDKKLHLVYSDSMLVAAKHTEDNLVIGSAYLTRATVYYGLKKHNLALDNFIKADEFISKTEDSYSIYKVKYGIAQTKYYLGFYDEAIALFRECIDYFKDENDRAYLNSLHCLGLCYNRIGKQEWCTLTNQMGIDEGQRLENLEMEYYFIHSEGVNQSCKGNYKEAIKKLNAALPEICKVKDFANESVAYFYIGKSYWLLKQQKKAVYYFKKVDEIFKKEKYVRPDLREGFELLIDYYRHLNDTKLQLLYINQLLKVDQLLAQNYKYLLKKIVKEYDTKELIKEKQHIENTMTISIGVGFTIIIILLLIMIFLIRKNARNKKLFKELMNQDSHNPEIRKSINNNNKQLSTEISPDIEAGIVKKLEKFELSKKYLEKDMTLVKMATLLHTNTKYVTRVIAKHREKRTIDYITDLKIEYIIQILKTESKFQNYTNKALGEEAGFGSTQNFTRAFKSHTGITPTYFIHQLKKSIMVGDLQ